MVNIGINGAGRIGRLVLRAAVKKNTPVKVLNDPFMELKYAVYLLNYDSVHNFNCCKAEIVNDTSFKLGEQVIQFTSEKDPASIPWGKNGVDVVVECTGVFLEKTKCEAHIKGGAKKVIMSAPAKDDTATFVCGVNVDMNGDNPALKKETFVSNASCTTNCLAPITKILNDNFGIVEGLMTTIHAGTAVQNVVDGVAKGGKDWRAGRSCFGNIIPASTGAAKAVGKVIPEVNGKLTGMAFRVPTADVSCVDLTVKLAKPTSIDAIYELVKQNAEGPMKGVLCHTKEHVVSTDFVTCCMSSVFDYGACIALNDTFFKIVAWYDNEWGYSNRCIDLANKMI